MIVYGLAEGIAVVGMADPGRRNALGGAMIAGLVGALERAAAEGARAVVLRSEGGSVWCAGFDIGQLGVGVDPLADDGALKGLFRAVEACPAPVIAMLNGTAWGGGADLALRCDMAVASEACTLAFTPARLGLPYDTEGLLNVLLRGGMGVAMEMFATGDALDARRALAAGLVNHVVPEGELEGFTMALAGRIVRNAPLSVGSAKAQLRALNTALAVPGAVRERLDAGRAAALGSADFAEGLAAFREKRAPRFAGR